MANNTVTEKKKALVARKEKLLQDIQYYERRISDFHASRSATSIYEDNCSSDSDSDFPITDNGPSVTQLKLQQSHLKTSLQATQELTNLHLLEHEINVMVTDPVIENESKVREPGVWKEVIAECRLDLVPFSITFHVHKPNVKFGAPSYRNLKVILSKPAHETELANSVLAHIATPSEAVEVIGSYSQAHRSRRTTLARLAEKYPNLLFMEPLAEGGYILKCAGLLEVCWTLQNKWSAIAPFHHRMRFDLEYMDESYIKIITQYHRQLSDPSLETDERTALLSKIINTCLEAKGPTQELYESMESDDPETAQTLRQRRMTLDQEVTDTAPKRKRDDAIMAPPKSLPKKSKPKGKENKAQSNERASKVRGNEDNVSNASGRDSVVSGKSKDSRHSEVRSENAKGKDLQANQVSHNVKENVKSIKESGNKKGEKTVKEKDSTVTIVASVKSKESKKDAVSTKENSKLAKGVGDKAENSESTHINSAKENSKPTKEMEHRKDIKSNKEKDGKKDTVVKSKERKDNSEDRNSVAKLAKKDSDATKTKKNANTNQANKPVDEVNNPKDTNVASSKATKKSIKDKNFDDESNKNSAKLAKKSIVSKPKDSKEQMDKDTEKINSDKGSVTTKVNAKDKITDTNKTNDNIEKAVPKKLKKTDEIANVPAKKAKIDHTTKNSDANIKTTDKSKKSINNINKPKQSHAKNDNVNKNNVKNDNINKNNAKSNEVTEKKDSTYTKSSETIQKVTEKNMIATKKPNLAERTDITQKTAKNIESLQKKTSTIHDKVQNIEQNIKNKIQNSKLVNVQDKTKNLKNNIENNKNINNGRLSQKFKATGNTKLGGVKKLSAGNTVKETSTDSKLSKIPQSLTKVANSLKKNPLRISPRKLSTTLKGVAGVKKAIQKPITSIPRLLKKPVVKT